MSKCLVSRRGFPLFYSDESKESGKTVITGEDYYKWYDLYIVFPSGVVTAVDYSVLEDFASTPYIDHNPNPEAVLAFAEKNGLIVDSLALAHMKCSWEKSE